MKKEFLIERCIILYDKNTSMFVSERYLKESEFSLTDLIDIFGYHKSDPLLYNAYDIDKKIAIKISNKINFEFDFSNYDYCLETFSINLKDKSEFTREKDK